MNSFHYLSCLDVLGKAGVPAGQGYHKDFPARPTPDPPPQRAADELMMALRPIGGPD